ncbi:chalcone isomerase family protein [Gillisia sp. M10.2A]|uniref:Chalcone isomerase family protein n=1 Tax=Gillisia lutea TaxID=2909668 RepID=A0ABS9ELU7_9FLAO|nr:chalcone isomerase family protein [Gillisia lutea]MCF4102780.1 chalcone isomerase family protein [Gillisia lutea]
MKKALFFIVALVGLATSSAQTKMAGVTLPNTVNFEGQSLSINGAGVREKFWMDMYAGALYLDGKSADAKGIINADKPMAIKLHIVSGLITSQKMIDAVNEGFENSTNGKTSGISKEITTFKNYFSEEISKNDVFDIVYIPSKGVLVYKNGKQKGTLQGMEFKKALFGIWLSDKPADKDLKKGMLGKS